MGRGRAKAKQTRVARQLKYAAPTTDLDALQRELRGASVDEHPEGVARPREPAEPGEGGADDEHDGYDEYDDEYDAYLPDDEDSQQ
jgi:hypothetical protein